MKMFDLFYGSSFGEAREDGLISVRKHPTEDLFIYNYTPKAMSFPGAWDNEAVLNCRGLIADFDDNVIARPWKKFFNHGDGHAPKFDLATEGYAIDKVDGSLGIVYWQPNAGKYAVATRGSFESDQALHATAILDQFIDHDYFRYWYGSGGEHTITPLVEIIYPENRIVLDYGDQDTLVLLGAMCLCGKEDTPRQGTWWSGPKAEDMVAQTLGEALALPPRPNAEGIVFTSWDGEKVKIKQEDYLILHRAIFNFSKTKVWEHAVAGGTLEELIEGLPDEMHALARQYWFEILDGVSEKVAHIYQIYGTLRHIALRRDFALEALKYEEAPYLFMLFDSRDSDYINSAVLKAAKPKG